MDNDSEPFDTSRSEITLGVLNSIEANSRTSQREVARDLGVALGLINAYLKRCIKKGYVKVQQVPANRYAYYLTPHGFREKSRLTVEFLSHSLKFFRTARTQCSQLLTICQANGWHRVGLYSVSELAEIALLCGRECGVDLVAVIDPGHAESHMLGVPVLRQFTAADLDAVLITDLAAPQSAWEHAARVLPPERVLAPAVLHVRRVLAAAPEAAGS